MEGGEGPTKTFERAELEKDYNMEDMKPVTNPEYKQKLIKSRLIKEADADSILEKIATMGFYMYPVRP